MSPKILQTTGMIWSIVIGFIPMGSLKERRYYYYGPCCLFNTGCRDYLRAELDDMYVDLPTPLPVLISFLRE